MFSKYISFKHTEIDKIIKTILSAGLCQFRNSFTNIVLPTTHGTVVFFAMQAQHLVSFILPIPYNQWSFRPFVFKNKVLRYQTVSICCSMFMVPNKEYPQLKKSK